MLNKSKVTDVVSILLISISYILDEPYARYLMFAGLFALSGAITNQLAIYMLFEKVPFLYGSGVIEKNFEKFKESIKNMIMEQFFTKDKIIKFFEEKDTTANLTGLVESADFTPAFDALKQSVMESKFGSMMQMFGGEEALEPLRDSFGKKMKKAVVSIVNTDTFRSQLNHHMAHSTFSSGATEQIDSLVTSRLDELTPKMVKELVHNLIHEHLGWLVVWGGVFGGIIGLISSLIVPS